MASYRSEIIRPPAWNLDSIVNLNERRAVKADIEELLTDERVEALFLKVRAEAREARERAAEERAAKEQAAKERAAALRELTKADIVDFVIQTPRQRPAGEELTESDVVSFLSEYSKRWHQRRK